jgi:hypothetical protein
MQPIARSGLTADQVTSIIRDAPAVQLSAGLELLDMSLNVLADISDDFGGGSVSRSSYDTLHGTASIIISRQLNWANAVIRPYVNLTDGVITARFNEGAYLTSTPVTETGETPITWAVDGYDILHVLNTFVGDAYAVATGTAYLAAAEQILIDQGIKAYTIDQTAAAKVLDAPRVWVLDTQTTWLNVVNDLLAAVGYRGVYSDWDGNLRMEPYVSPTDRSPEFVYDTGLTTSMLAPKATTTRDYFNAPNRWVFYWSKDPATAPPVEGAGLYTFVNYDYGPTSVNARGRVITATPVQLDAVDQDSLIVQATSLIDADLRLKTTFSVSVFPNPLHWHFDRVLVGGSQLGPIMDVLVSKWTLSFDGVDGTQEWQLL